MKIHERLSHWIADPDQERAKLVTLTLKASGFYWDLSGSSLGFVLCYCSNFHVFLSPALDGSGRWRLGAVPHNIHSDLRCHSTAEQRRKPLAGHSLIICTSHFAVSPLQPFYCYICIFRNLYSDVWECDVILTSVALETSTFVSRSFMTQIPRLKSTRVCVVIASGNISFHRQKLAQFHASQRLLHF